MLGTELLTKLHTFGILAALKWWKFKIFKDTTLKTGSKHGPFSIVL